MIATKLTPKILLALACCLFIVLVPLSVGAQTPGGLIRKGAEEVKKGAETTVDKTKEGAEYVGDKTKEGMEYVGKGVKKAVTGEDTSTSTKHMKSSGTTTAQSSGMTRSTTGKSMTTGRAKMEHRRLPRTAGELPLLALAGVLALTAAGVSRVVRLER